MRTCSASTCVAEGGLVVGHRIFDIEVCVPHGEDRLRGEGAHCRAVGLNSSQGSLLALLPAESVFSSRDDHTGGARGVPAHDVDPVASAPAVRPAHPRRQPPRPYARGDGAGTVGVTALGMAGRGGGWGLAPAGQSLLLIVAARFVQRLVDLIDGGYGLEGEEEEDAQDAPGPAASSG